MGALGHWALIGVYSLRMAVRDKLNSEILAETPLSEIWQRLCLNALGQLDPPLKQTEMMSIEAVLKRTIPSVKALDVEVEAKGEFKILWDK